MNRQMAGSGGGNGGASASAVAATAAFEEAQQTAKAALDISEADERTTMFLLTNEFATGALCVQVLMVIQRPDGTFAVTRGNGAYQAHIKNTYASYQRLESTLEDIDMNHLRLNLLHHGADAYLAFVQLTRFLTRRVYQAWSMTRQRTVGTHTARTWYGLPYTVEEPLIEYTLYVDVAETDQMRTADLVKRRMQKVFSPRPSSARTGAPAPARVVGVRATSGMQVLVPTATEVIRHHGGGAAPAPAPTTQEDAEEEEDADEEEEEEEEDDDPPLVVIAEEVKEASKLARSRR